MSRLLSRSADLLSIRCKDISPQKMRSYSSLWSNNKCTLRKHTVVFQQNRALFTSLRQRIFQIFRSKQSKIWILGLGAGFVLTLGLMDRVYLSERSDCNEAENDRSESARYCSAIEISRDLLQRIKDEVGAPGIVVGVSVDGTPIWLEGLGYADLENRVACCPKTVMRIASISKPLTAVAVARLWGEGQLDLDAPVQKYVPEFPEKQFEGEAVTITTRMLLSHLSGIRHYERDAKKVKELKEKAKRLLKLPEGQKKEEEKNIENTESPKMEDSGTKSKQANRKKEFEHEEYYLKEGFQSVIDALDLFKDDPLIFKPGTTFLYSTHAYTLVSAVVERVVGQRFLDHMMKVFRELGMLNTVPEKNDPIIYHRSRFYNFTKKGRVVNCPYVDNSYKWAGGGFLSTVGDLLLFGNAMLYSYQIAHVKNVKGLLPGFLKPETIRATWTPVDKTEPTWDRDGLYGMGWLVVEKQQDYGHCRSRRHYVSHTGGAVGASSVLLVYPSDPVEPRGDPPALPKGVVVTIIANMQSVGLNTTALKIAQEFDKARGV
ncbi:serine beta-lactamase-like protein LACTB, mitochondrial isoform X2 [Conger conger]|uniref:serine beta-lactamase-like protein LACTB, mitochondrial isoform X2 n=1 Tax=Conger conger TaxID=82655 RepID=UPI002A599F4C|nr:serine beta-lactamase-like protein LACTB, mitochondrial isoform X2 [Conger conger]